MKHGMIVIPDSRAWHNFTITGLLWRISQAKVPDWKFSLVLVGGMSPSHAPRNRAVDIMLQSSATHLIFLGSDNLFDESFFLLLSQADKDIVGGAYFTYQDTGNPGDALKIVGGPFERGVTKTEPFDADYIGLDCAMIQRRVFEDERMLVGPKRWFQTLYEGEYGQASMTDDTDFCERAKTLGYQITLDPRIECGHEKTLDLGRVVPIIQFQVDHAIEQFRKTLEPPAGSASGHGSAAASP